MVAVDEHHVVPSLSTNFFEVTQAVRQVEFEIVTFDEDKVAHHDLEHLVQPNVDRVKRELLLHESEHMKERNRRQTSIDSDLKHRRFVDSREEPLHDSDASMVSHSCNVQNIGTGSSRFMSIAPISGND
jgi:hypothetical protein